MDGADAATKAALALGAFGSLLGLLNLGLKAIEVWRDRAHLELGMRPGSGPIIGWGRHTVDPDENVYITITNRGRRPVRVTSAGLLHKDRTSLALMQDSLGQQVFPAVLDERTPSVDVSAKTRDLQDRYGTAGQSLPTHIFCYVAGKRRARRLSPEWVTLLASAPGTASQEVGKADGGASGQT